MVVKTRLGYARAAADGESSMLEGGRRRRIGCELMGPFPVRDRMCQAVPKAETILQESILTLM